MKQQTEQTVKQAFLSILALFGYRSFTVVVLLAHLWHKGRVGGLQW